jgi:hypothetical protein
MKIVKQINLGLRFLLEITALVAAGIWGWSEATGIFQYFFAVGIPVLFATIWGIFAVPDDPSRSGKTFVAVPGWLRLIIELILLGFAAWSFFDLGYRRLGSLFTSFLLLHYLFFFDRIRWLLRH